MVKLVTFLRGPGESHSVLGSMLGLGTPERSKMVSRFKEKQNCKVGGKGAENTQEPSGNPSCSHYE